MLKRRNVIKDCDALLNRQRENKNRMENLQREKDYKVQKISKEYESEIEECLKIDESLSLQIEMVKKYVELMDGDTVTQKVTKKRA